MDPSNSPQSLESRGSSGSAVGVLERASAVQRALDRYWIGIAATLRRYSLLLSEAWYDGIYLTAWPRVALAAPALALLFGLLEGITHWTLLPGDNVVGGQPVVAFTELLVFMVVVAAASALSANFGLLLVGGYALGDLLFAGPQATLGLPTWAQNSALVAAVLARVPQLISYALFLLLVITPTLSAKYLPARLRLGLREESTQLWLLRSAARVVVQAAFVYTWTLAAPLLIRVFWGWGDASPPLAAAYFLQVQGNWLVYAALLAALLRSWLTHEAYRQAATRQRVDRLEAALVSADTRQAPTRRVPPAARAVLTAAGLTLLLSGFIAGLLDAAIVCVFIGLILIARTLWLPRFGWWTSWARQVTRIPVALRLVAVFIAGNFEGQIIVNALSQLSSSASSASATFLPVLLSVCLGILTAVVLLPQVEQTPERPDGAKAAESPQPA
jgi:hypothetical protein